MNTIGIIGLGYVGLTTAACFLKRGFKVHGFEINQKFTTSLKAGKCPISENQVDEVVLTSVSNSDFKLFNQINSADLPELVFVCVGTPSASDGSTNLDYLQKVLTEIDKVKKESRINYEIVIRSSIPPGTLKKTYELWPELFYNGSVVFYPEFLREGTAMDDFFNPPQTLIGKVSESHPPNNLLKILSFFGFEPSLCDSLTAETIKFASNAYHAIKVTFGNEIARLVTQLGGNANEVMQSFCKDKILNISDKYLLPGAPFGGSCLPKDTKSLIHTFNQHKVNSSLISSCLISNEEHLNYLVRKIESFCPKTILVLGTAFKSKTDDTRESPSVKLCSFLLNDIEAEITLHDFEIDNQMIETNRHPQLSELIANPKLAFTNNLPDNGKFDLIIIMHPDNRYIEYAKKYSIPCVNVAHWTL